MNFEYVWAWVFCINCKNKWVGRMVPMFCQNVFHVLLNIRKRKWLSRLVWRPPKKSSRYKRYTMIKGHEYGTSVCVGGEVLPETHSFFWALTKLPKSYFMLIHLREILRARWKSSGNVRWRHRSLLSPERTLTLSFGFVPYFMLRILNNDVVRSSHTSARGE